MRAYSGDEQKYAEVRFYCDPQAWHLSPKPRALTYTDLAITYVLAFHSPFFCCHIGCLILQAEVGEECFSTTCAHFVSQWLVEKHVQPF